MVPPSIVVKDGMGGRRFSGSFSWSAATERLGSAIPVVINSEFVQLPLSGGERMALAAKKPATEPFGGRELWTERRP